ncbi:MAG: response regulator transcription factor [Elusimicrobia bacterium]|nr:response regulator transcription factor [Elusimicrobiota bacterium]
MVILIVGGDSAFRRQLRALLESQNHEALMLPEPSKAAGAAEGRGAHLVLVALGSCAESLRVIRSVRRQPSTRRIPILQVDPRGAPEEVVQALDAGADDCLARPFNPEVFLARVRTLLRRQIWSGNLREEPATLLKAGDIVVRLLERTVSLGREEIAMTRLEFELLVFFMRNMDKALKRAEILEAVWKYPEDVETRTLDKHVESLRRKLGASGRLIRTIRGVGYRFLDPRSPELSSPQ